MGLRESLYTATHDFVTALALCTEHAHGVHGCVLLERLHSGLTINRVFSPFFMAFAATASALKEPPPRRENTSPPSGDSATTASLPWTLTL